MLVYLILIACFSFTLKSMYTKLVADSRSVGGGAFANVKCQGIKRIIFYGCFEANILIPST